MILPRLRQDLDVMTSPVAERPGLLIRDFFHFSDAVLIIPPLLVPALRLFNGRQTDRDLEAALGSAGGADLAAHLIDTLSQSGFLEDENFAARKQNALNAFRDAPVRRAAHAGSAYPDEIDALREVMRTYLGPTRSHDGGECIGIAAPHVSPSGGWQCYQAAYHELTPDLADRTFVILGTSHYGEPGRFGLTRKPYQTPFGDTTVDLGLIDELASGPAVLMEDYCHAVEHSIEFQVLFLQAIYGPQVRIVPILCGSFGRSIYAHGMPEDESAIEEFFSTLARIAEREGNRLVWVLGVDMAHIGQRYGDKFAAHAEQGGMVRVRERDQVRIERINAGDAAGFWKLVRENREDLRWCGSSPFYTFMKAVPGARGKLLRYEQWNIDEQSVVTFAGMAFRM
jgi:MEMO1 family protein